MNIYFTATSTIKGDTLRYSKILAAIHRLNHTIVSGDQIVTEKTRSVDASKSAKFIFAREKERMDRADCIVAEVTNPSSGVGGEIVYALIHEKPVLALFYKDADNTLSPMIAGNPSDNLYLEHYEDDNIHIMLKRFFSQVSLMKKRKGKLIVIDGGDGSGKATQSCISEKARGTCKIYGFSPLLSIVSRKGRRQILDR
jgi:nucleoside 2-deoxyribosyltransferase